MTNVQITSPRASTFQQWSSFLSVLNGDKKAQAPLLNKASTADRIVSSLEKQLPQLPRQQIFRRLGKHTQLSLHFS